VIVEVVVPSAVTEVGTATTVEVEAETALTVPVALKVTGEPLSEPLVAVRVLELAVVPRVQLPTVAMPEASVVASVPVTEPPPEVTAKVTGTPETGLP